MSNRLTEEEKAFLAEVKADREREKAMERRRELPRYDFTEAEKELQTWYSPSELSTQLKDAVLLASCRKDADCELTIQQQLCEAVVNVCGFLDRIKEVHP